MNKVDVKKINDTLSKSQVKVETIHEKCTFMSCKLPNGFVLTASSGAVDKANYDVLIGEQECMKKIKDELWKLEGYHLANLIADKKLKNLSFGEAVEQLKKGEWISRKGWNGKGMYLSLQEPTDKSKMTRSYIYMKTADDMLVPWVASQSDILCDDWYVFNVKSIQVKPSYIISSIESGNKIVSSKVEPGLITNTLEDKKAPYVPVSSDIGKW